MNVLVLNWLDRENPMSGGAETHLHETFGRFAERGWEVTLLSSGWRGAASHTVLDGMEVLRVGTRHSYGLTAPPYVRMKLRGRSFDLVLEDLNKAPLYSPLWAPSPCALIVHHLFGASAFQGAALPVAATIWLLEGTIARVYRNVPTVAVSESTRSELVDRGFREDRIQVAENGVDAERYSPDPDRPTFPEPTILYLGRLKKYKRVDLILEALTLVHEMGLQARLLIAGRGDAEAQLRRRAERLELGSSVEFLGFVSEEMKLELLQRSWINVITSVKEGWGITNLEAAACGTPTIASDSPGLRDSVVDGQTGFLVPHGDAGALAAKVHALLTDELLRLRMGQGARQFALRFSWARCADRLEEVLRAAVAAHSRPD